MAKQVEGFLVGTYDDITFYKMEGQYYARMKSSLTGKKFWKDKAFEGSRRSCNRFGRGNQLASIVYNEIPASRREYALYCKMKSVAIRMIKEGKDENQVMEELRMMKPVVRRKIVRREIKIRQLDNLKICEFEDLKMWGRCRIRQFGNSTMRQWEEKHNLKICEFENLKMREEGGIRQLDNSTMRQWRAGGNLKIWGFEDLKMGGEGRIRQFGNLVMRRDLTIRQFDNSTIAKGRRLRFRFRLRGADHDDFVGQRSVVADDG